MSTGVLNLTNVQTSQGGVYTCMLLNVLTEARRQKSVTINIYGVLMNLIFLKEGPVPDIWFSVVYLISGLTKFSFNVLSGTGPWNVMLTLIMWIPTIPKCNCCIIMQLSNSIEQRNHQGPHCALCSQTVMETCSITVSGLGEPHSPNSLFLL